MVSEHSNPPSMNQRGWTILIRRGLQWCKALCLIWDLLSLHFATINMDPHHAGTSQPSGATLACEPCLKGEYQDLTGQQTCKRCDVGYYQDEERGPICKSALGDTLYTIFQFFTIYREITACCVFEVSTCQCFSRRRKKDQTSATKSVLVERLSIALT